MPEIAAYLRRHDFRELFTEELGWDHDSGEIEFDIRGVTFLLRLVACKRGFRVLHTSVEHHVLFDRKWLREIQTHVFQHAHEHVLIASCDRPQKQVWMWATTSGSGRNRRHREHPFFSNAPSDGILLRLESVRFALSEEESIQLVDAAERVRKALDTDPELDLFVRRPWYARRSHELAKARKSGGVQAFQRFVEFHLPMLPRAANQWWIYMRGLDHEERIQIVALGLLRAALKYDEDRGTQFSTYAHIWLRNFAQRYGPLCHRFVQLPHYHWRTRRIAFEALRKLGARADPDSTMRAMNQLAETDLTLLGHLIQIQSTDVIDSFDDATKTAFREARLVPTLELDGFSWQERCEANQVISGVLSEIPVRERTVIEMRFGLHGPQYTLQEVAGILGVTRERVRQLEVLALSKLRPRLARSFGVELPSQWTSDEDEQQDDSQVTP